MKRRITSGLMSTLLLIGMLPLIFNVRPIGARFYPGYGKGAATFYIDPQYSNFSCPPTVSGTWFTVDVRIANATNIAGWQVELSYNKEYLFTGKENASYADDMIFPPGTYFQPLPFVGVFNSTHNLIMMTTSTLEGVEYDSGVWPESKGLMTVSFQIIKTPAMGETLSSLLHFAVLPEAALGSWTIDNDIYENDLTLYDGSFNIYGNPFGARFYPGYGSGAATFYLTPQYNNFRSPATSNGTWFTVEVRIANATNIAGWQVELSYNKEYLFTRKENASYADDMIFPPGTYSSTSSFVGILNSTHNLIMMTATTYEGTEYDSGTWPATKGLMTASFQIIETPAMGETLSSLLHFAVLPEAALGSWTIDSGIYENDLTVCDGLFKIEGKLIRDVAVASVVPSATEALEGSLINVDVYVQNQGDFNETFNVTVYGNTTTIGAPVTLDLTSLNSTLITFTWNTTGAAVGNHIMRATASVVPEETDTSDNTAVDGTVLILPNFHDVAVASVVPSVSEAMEGSLVSVYVYVQNQGGFDETFNVTAYANATVVDKRVDLFLEGLSSTEITFIWNTTGAAVGNHTIRVDVSIVPGETDTGDNTGIDGIVLIFPRIHDVGIADVRISNEFVYQGDIAGIFVDVRNRGDFSETFNVTTYADPNTTITGDEVGIETRSVSLPSRGFTTKAFLWNTTGVPSGNYTISAVASQVTQEADLTDNSYINGKIGIFQSLPCYDINITAPKHIELNPSIFNFDWSVRALEVPLGNMTIDSTGYVGPLRVLGSTNGTVHLRIDQPHLEFEVYDLPENGSIQVPLWLLFDPGSYSGTYQLQMIVCGVHRLNLTVDIVHIWVCSNGCYSVAGGTATFNWTVTGGSWVYLEAEPNLPSGWSFTVDPAVGTLFETPHEVFVNITAASDAQEGDVGSVTLRAYHNGTNILIWQFIFFSSVDSKPPTIEQTKPPTLTYDGNLLFNTTVMDKSGIENVQLYYSINSGPWINQSMQWDSGDTFNSTAYTLAIPHVPDNSVINYYVVATDWLRNQTQSDTQAITVKYDQAITEIKAEKTVVGQGWATQINVTIANQGSIPSTSLKILVYANKTLIYTHVMPFLANGTIETLTFNWNTTFIPKGNHIISAYAVPLQDESDTSNNVHVGSAVLVSLQGDVTGDKKVDGRDIALVAKHFGSVSGYPPNADINDDNKVDGRDIAIAARNFGQIWT